MPAYMIFIRDKMIDPKEMEVYGQKAMHAVGDHKMNPLSIYGRHEVVEGPDVEGVAIIEFENAAAAKAWYDSPAYKEARAHRFKGAEYRAMIVDGI